MYRSKYFQTMEALSIQLYACIFQIKIQLYLDNVPTLLPANYTCRPNTNICLPFYPFWPIRYRLVRSVTVARRVVLSKSYNNNNGNTNSHIFKIGKFNCLTC